MGGNNSRDEPIIKCGISKKGLKCANVPECQMNSVPLYQVTFSAKLGPSNTSGASEFTPVIIGVRVTRSFVLCVCFVDRCL
jgi:hypothetical protein